MDTVENQTEPSTPAAGGKTARVAKQQGRRSMLQDRPKRPCDDSTKSRRLTAFLKKGKDLQTQHDACVLSMVIFPNKLQVTRYAYAFNPIAEKWLKSPAGEYFKKSFMQFCETEIVKNRYAQTNANPIAEAPTNDSTISDSYVEDSSAESAMDTETNSVTTTEQRRGSENERAITIPQSNAGNPFVGKKVSVKLLRPDKKPEGETVNLVLQYKGKFDRRMSQQEVSAMMEALVNPGDTAIVTDLFLVKKVEEYKFLITPYGAPS